MESHELQLTAVSGEVPPLTAQEVYSQVQRIQEIMQKVMLEGTHYGVIPGTGQKSLWKAGAEKIIFAFHLVPRIVHLEDLSSALEVRYRIRTAIDGPRGNLLGEGVGECSSLEEKFGWREAICQEEFDATDPIMRRDKYKRDAKGVFVVHQVRTNPADQLNAVLKRAKKRSLVDAVLTTTAASDCFAQELEEEDSPAANEQTKLNTVPPRAAKPPTSGARLEGIFKSASPSDLKVRRPGRVILVVNQEDWEFTFWDTPGPLALEKDWAKFAGKACIFSFERNERKGRVYNNLTWLQFPSQQKATNPDLFESDTIGQREREAAQEAEEIMQGGI